MKTTAFTLILAIALPMGLSGQASLNSRHKQYEGELRIPDKTGAATVRWKLQIRQERSTGPGGDIEIRYDNRYQSSWSYETALNGHTPAKVEKQSSGGTFSFHPAFPSSDRQELRLRVSDPVFDRNPYEVRITLYYDPLTRFLEVEDIRSECSGASAEDNH